ncbi:hypothetical protein MSAN_02504400 [Mycena sanguinolenta]|uniref:Uncharacterized protein n=1 Tax=Mycena sanguinolenta TaxID=230812 RepID=A0A8H6TWC0_9AGAR|nr:hypothetical protein MSAN_02504400 [Mycena sanguinolenta]
MKSSATFFLGVSGAMAAAVADPGPSSAASSAISVLVPPVISSFSESIALPPTTSIPTPTGGFIVTGVYTTCLTLTFSNPAETGSSTTSSDSFALSATASSAPGVSSVTGTDVGVVPTAILSDTAVSASATASGGPIIPPIADEAVFTTCLAFLATPTITDPVTSTFATGSASIAVPSVSATASPSASAVTLE